MNDLIYCCSCGVILLILYLWPSKRFQGKMIVKNLAAPVSLGDAVESKQVQDQREVEIT